MSAKPFTTRLDAEVKTRLEAIAHREDRSASYLAKKAITDFVEQSEREHQLVVEARVQIENGEGISEEKIDEWMSSWAEGVDRPFPSSE